MARSNWQGQFSLLFRSLQKLLSNEFGKEAKHQKRAAGAVENRADAWQTGQRRPKMLFILVMLLSPKNLSWS